MITFTPDTVRALGEFVRVTGLGERMFQNALIIHCDDESDMYTTLGIIQLSGKMVSAKGNDTENYFMYDVTVKDGLQITLMRPKPEEVTDATGQ